MNTTKHAVLTQQALIFIHEEERKLQQIRLKGPITHIRMLWEMGQTYGFTHFWIMPGTQFDQLRYDSLTDDGDFKTFVPLRGTEREEPEPRSARCWKDHAPGTHQIIVGYPARYPFDWTVEKPLDVLACIDYLEQTLSIPVQWSPMSMGEAYLKGLYSATHRLQSYLRSPETDLKKLPFKAQDVRWNRAIKPSEYELWVHMYDKNSAHPAAASSMSTGCGDPTYLPCEPPVIKPGSYRVTFDPQTSPFDGETLPPIIEEEWITADLLKFARRQGYTVTVHEAWVFNESHKLFGEWARDLWEARKLLRDQESFCYEPGRKNAYNTMKDILNKTISALRPNWWADMVNCARMAVLANILKLLAEKSITPFLVYHDDIAFISKEPDITLAIPGLLDRQDKLGGYKVKGSIKLTPELAQRINECDKPAKVITLLKRAR